MNHRIAKLKISYKEIETDNHSTVQVIVPVCVCDKILTDALDWEDNWRGQVSEIRELLEAIENYKTINHD